MVRWRQATNESAFGGLPAALKRDQSVAIRENGPSNDEIADKAPWINHDLVAIRGSTVRWCSSVGEALNQPTEFFGNPKLSDQSQVFEILCPVMNSFSTNALRPTIADCCERSALCQWHDLPQLFLIFPTFWHFPRHQTPKRSITVEWVKSNQQAN